MSSKLFLGVAVVLTVAFMSCNNSQNTQSQTEAQTEQKDEIMEGAPVFSALKGTYEGTIPGADNGGCKYTVVFGDDGRCTLTRTYKKEGLEPETITGTFEYSLALIPHIVCKFAKDAPVCFMRESKNEIIMVDEQGNEAEMRKDYILTRVDAQ